MPSCPILLIFDAMVEGMESVVQKDNYKLKVITFYEKRDNLEHYLGDLRTTDCVGIILLVLKCGRKWSVLS